MTTSRISRRALLRSASILAATTLPGLPALASQGSADWPQRPVKWLVPYLSGTGPDTAARIVGEALGKVLGQAIVIENRPGAGGNIGARLVARAPADGYTLLYSGSPMAAAQRIYKQPGFDVFKDFRHVLSMSRSDILVVVHPDSGIRSMAELVARCKAQPVDYASGGTGTPSHLGVELLMASAGFKASHVPYKGASELVTAVLGQQVLFGVPVFSVAYPHVQSGKLVALGVASPQRNARLPKVPTLAEQGIADANVVSWGGVSVPAGTPDAVVNRLRDALTQVLRDPQVVESLERNGGMVDIQSADAYVESFKREIAFTEAMMKRVKLDPI